MKERKRLITVVKKRKKEKLVLYTYNNYDELTNVMHKEQNRKKGNRFFFILQTSLSELHNCTECGVRML